MEKETSILSSSEAQRGNEKKPWINADGTEKTEEELKSYFVFLV